MASAAQNGSNLLPATVVLKCSLAWAGYRTVALVWSNSGKANSRANPIIHVDNPSVAGG